MNQLLSWATSAFLWNSPRRGSQGHCAHCDSSMATTMTKKTTQRKKAARPAAGTMPPAGKLQLLAIRLVESMSKLGMLKGDKLPGHAVQPMEFTLNVAKENPKLLAVI